MTFAKTHIFYAGGVLVLVAGFAGWAFAVVASHWSTWFWQALLWWTCTDSKPKFLRSIGS